MSKSDPWKLLATLHDRPTSALDKARWEAALADDPQLQARWQTFQELLDWAQEETAALASAPPAQLFAELDHERQHRLLDREIGRLFPWVAAVGLAAVLVLALVNFDAMKDFAESPVDACLGLPDPSLDNSLAAHR